MSTSIDFGYVPYQQNLHLTRDADYVTSLRTSDGSPWPVGATITQKVGSASWDATIVDDVASWNVDKVVVNALVPDTQLETSLVYTDTNGVDLVWFIGAVIWHG